jgi:polar amino acid transport system substrate-binding protein
MNVKGLTMLPTPLEENHLYHYLNIKHSSLVPQITEVLQVMLDSGKLDSIRTKIESNLQNTSSSK